MSKIVIIGGGIIGVSSAYYLAQRGQSCTIIEKTGIACAASGKAGGFLAKTWCDSYEVGPLANASFDLHMNFAENNDMTKICDYRRVKTLGVKVKPSRNEISSPSSFKSNWIDGNVSNAYEMESPKNAAQVHPYKLTHELLSQAISLTNGATNVIKASVIGLNFDSNKNITGVKLNDGTVLPADKILISMGPWSADAADWFPPGCLPRIRGHRAHSIVMKPNCEKEKHPGAECLFLEYKHSQGSESPEIYPRPDGTIYMCGLGDDIEVPESADQVVVDKWRCTKLREIAYSTASCLETADILIEQACFLPISPDGLPLIGSIPGVQGAFVATGHSCWGILNAPGTGKAMADLMMDGQSSFIDISAFDPKRFQNKH